MINNRYKYLSNIMKLLEPHCNIFILDIKSRKLEISKLKNDNNSLQN